MALGSPIPSARCGGCSWVLALAFLSLPCRVDFYCCGCEGPAEPPLCLGLAALGQGLQSMAGSAQGYLLLGKSCWWPSWERGGL